MARLLQIGCKEEWNSTPLGEKMFTNQSMFDRKMRMILGALIFSLLFWGPKSHWGYLGLIIFLTGLFGICPIYRVLGIKTRRWDDENRL